MSRPNKKRSGLWARGSGPFFPAPSPQPRASRAEAARLWAPWRSVFLAQAGVRRACIFCAARRSHEDRRRYVVGRSQHALAMLNLYPYNNGHAMVAPRRHVGTLERLRAEEWADMLQLLQGLIRRLQAALRPHGFNVGINVGRAAGAGIPGHLHVHVVPRWSGDTNFMPLLGQTKVISQSLDELYRLLTGGSGAPRRRRRP